jgi:hypothetical protein
VSVACVGQVEEEEHARTKLSSLGSSGAISSDALFGNASASGSSMRGRGASDGESVGDFMEKLGGQVSSDLRRVSSKVKDSTSKMKVRRVETRTLLSSYLTPCTYRCCRVLSRTASPRLFPT